MEVGSVSSSSSSGKGQTLHQPGMPVKGFELYLEGKALSAKTEQDREINTCIYQSNFTMKIIAVFYLYLIIAVSYKYNYIK